MSRGEANRTLSQKKMDDEYREAGILVNLDGRVPLDEAAPCYKPSDEVVAAVVDAGLAEIEHSYGRWPRSRARTSSSAGARGKAATRATATANAAKARRRASTIERMKVEG